MKWVFKLKVQLPSSTTMLTISILPLLFVILSKSNPCVTSCTLVGTSHEATLLGVCVLCVQLMAWRGPMQTWVVPRHACDANTDHNVPTKVLVKPIIGIMLYICTLNIVLFWSLLFLLSVLFHYLFSLFCF